MNSPVVRSGPTTWRARAQDGAVVEVSIPSLLLADLTRVLPPFGLDILSGPADPPALELALGVEPVGELGAAARPAWDRLESDLGLFTAEHLVDQVAIHAGVAVWQGVGVVVPGPSFAGKSTLCRALAARGATVLSDEYAIVDPATGLVSAWPRPLRVRRPGQAPERIVLDRVPSEPVPVGVVAALRYTPDRPDEVTRMSRAETVVELMANCVSARRSPQSALRAATALARGSVGIRGSHGDAGRTADRLLERLAQMPVQPPADGSLRPHA